MPASPPYACTKPPRRLFSVRPESALLAARSQPADLSSPSR